MYRKGKNVFVAILAASMVMSVIGCGLDNEPSQNAAQDAAENTEQDTMESVGREDAAGSVAENRNYSVTEENAAQELTMNNQPESSYWFPAQLLEWNAKEDEDFIYNTASVPLAKRVAAGKLNPVNSTQNKDTKIMAISIMNSSTSGNAPHGLNKVDANTFSYWQYVDMLVYWGGSSGEGLIVAPSPDVIDAGHKNGVAVTGTIFFPQTAHGGKMEWLDDFFTQNEDGTYPMVDKLIEVAEAYGFEGWFMNQETEGGKETPLTRVYADKMQQFLKEFREKAPDLELIYYDSMTVDGKMDWQNALTEKNVPFLMDEEGKQVADTMFLNFWWSEDKLAPQELLKSSAELAAKKGIDPYDLYAGIDLQSDGYATEIKWNLFENEEGGTYTSLGLYCPNWAYSSASTIQEFWKKENNLWVNMKGDPSEDIAYSGDTQWRGISNYIVERTAITSLPFVTNFSTGNGYSFFKDGKQVSLLDWNNRSISDVLPTYRYIIENEDGNRLKADFDVADAWYGGTSMVLRGDMAAGKRSVIKLYSADLPVKDGVVFTTTAKVKGASVSLDAVLTLDDGTEMVLPGDKKIGEEWTTVTYDTTALSGKTIRTISYRLASEKDSKGLAFRFGNITMAEGESAEKTTVSDVRVLGQEFDEDAMYAGVRLAWDVDVPADYYEVYRVNQDKSMSLLGVSNTTSFYVNTLPRTDETNQSVFAVVPVNALLEEGIGAQVTMEWPDNSVPKAGFTADTTILAPGEKVTFTSLCSPNTERVTWVFSGAKEEEAAGETVSAVYEKEGVYSVTVRAENASGESEKIVEKCIVVTEQAKRGLSLLSQGAGTEADTFVNEKEAPEFAVDGDVKTKWCATGSAPHEITLDLGKTQAVSAVDISHAQAGGEGADMNTKSYTIYISLDGAEWTEAANITRNTAGMTHDTFAPANARYVKLVINKPTQGSDSAARIYEVSVYGLDEAMEW